MTARRIDPGDWGRLPFPHMPRAPWWVALRHRAEIELGTLLATLGVALWCSAGSPLRWGAAGLVMCSLFLAEVREMAFGQWRRIVGARRLQSAFLELGLCSRHRGLTPTVVGSAAVPGATVIRLWLPVGLSADDLAKRRHALAEACFVDEVHVERRPGRPNTVEVVLVHRRLGRPL